MPVTPYPSTESGVFYRGVYANKISNTCVLCTDRRARGVPASDGVHGDNCVELTVCIHFHIRTPQLGDVTYVRRGQR